MYRGVDVRSAWPTVANFAIDSSVCGSCLTRLSPDKYSLFSGTSALQMVEYSCFKAGLICSLRNWANCVLIWPNKAITSTYRLIKFAFVEPGAFCSKKLVVCRVAKATLPTTCCIFANWRSIFGLLGITWFHILGLTFVPLTSPNFSGRSYLSSASKLFKFSEESFLPHRFVAMSVCCCKIRSPMASSFSTTATFWRI